MQADQLALRGSVKSVERSAYRIHEIQLASGTVLREFVGRDGVVFAVAWRGPAMPNLRQAMGRYFEPYVAAIPQKRRSRTQLHVEVDDLVVQSSGHMRAFGGRAYLAAAVPAGVSVGDLQ